VQHEIIVTNFVVFAWSDRGSNPRSTALDESTLTILRHQCGSEKYMNKYFEYMTGYIVLKHSGEWVKSGCLGIRIMCQSGATCLSADCCFVWTSTIFQDFQDFKILLVTCVFSLNYVFPVLIEIALSLITSVPIYNVLLHFCILQCCHVFLYICRCTMISCCTFSCVWVQYENNIPSHIFEVFIHIFFRATLVA
jgi:hypothetical protein